MLEGSIMQLICPECNAKYYLFGDFIADKGQFVRASERHWSQCQKCTIIQHKIFRDEYMEWTEENICQCDKYPLDHGACLVCMEEE